MATTKQVLQQRAVEATRNLRAALNLPSEVDDTGILGTALAEQAAEESRRNPQFARGVRQRYEELAALRGTTTKPAPKKRALPPLVPVGQMEPGERFHLDPFAPPDPRFLIRVYGIGQLDRALQDYTLNDLKQASAKIEATHPGTKPRTKASKQPIIDYIVRYSGTSD
jgi:hypothetical protein